MPVRRPSFYVPTLWTAYAVLAMAAIVVGAAYQNPFLELGVVAYLLAAIAIAVWGLLGLLVALAIARKWRPARLLGLLFTGGALLPLALGAGLAWKLPAQEPPWGFPAAVAVAVVGAFAALVAFGRLKRKR